MPRFDSPFYWLLWLVVVILIVTLLIVSRCRPWVRFTLYSWTIISSTIIALLIVYLIAFSGWKDVTQGRIHRIAQDMFTDTKYITKVEIFLLQGTDAQKTSTEFSSAGMGDAHFIHGSLTLTGADLIKFLEAWDGQKITPYGASCHDPAYGFRLYDGDTLVFETAICWACGTFSFAPFPGSTTIYGFERESDAAQKLLNHCDQLLPYARSPLR